MSDATTLTVDRERKLPIYLESATPSVWIVNIPERQLEIYDHVPPVAQVYLPADRAPAVAEAVVDLKALFHELPTDE